MQVLTKKLRKNSIRSSRRHGIINIHSKTTKNQPTQDLPKISGFLHFSGLLLHLDPAPIGVVVVLGPVTVWVSLNWPLMHVSNFLPNYYYTKPDRKIVLAELHKIVVSSHFSSFIPPTIPEVRHPAFFCKLRLYVKVGE